MLVGIPSIMVEIYTDQVFVTTTYRYADGSIAKQTVYHRANDTGQWYFFAEVNDDIQSISAHEQAALAMERCLNHHTGTDKAYVYDWPYAPQEDMEVVVG